MAFHAHYQDEFELSARAWRRVRAQQSQARAVSWPRGRRSRRRAAAQGFAFLTARLRQRLDDELPELSHSLIQLIWPQYLRPIPPLTILAFERRRRRAKGSRAFREERRCARARSTASIACSRPARRSKRCRSPSAGSRSTTARRRRALPFSCARSARPGFRRSPAGACGCFSTPSATCRLGGRCSYGCCATRPRSPAPTRPATSSRFPAATIRPVGFSEQDGVLPWPSNAFSGFQILQEHLMFPARFLFVELSGLAPVAAWSGKSLRIAIEFNRPFPDQLRVADAQCGSIARRRSTSSLTTASRCASSGRRANIACGRSAARATRCHSIVEASGFRQGRSQRQIYSPFELFRHDKPDDAGGGLFFRTRRARGQRPRRRHLRLVPRSRRRAGRSRRRGRLAARRNAPTGRSPTAFRSARSTRRPPRRRRTSSSATSTGAPEVPPPVGENLLWRLIADLARHYGAIFDIGALRNALSLYNFRAVRDAQARRRLELLMEGLIAFESETMDAVVRGVPARLRRVTLVASESKLGGEASCSLSARRSTPSSPATPASTTAQVRHSRR